MNIFTVITKISASSTLIATFWFVCFCHATEEFFFTASGYYTSNYVCVTNSSFALSWIKSDVSGKLDYASSFIPTPQPNTFDHSINDDATTMFTFLKKPWSLGNTTNLTKNEMILDRRWEEIPSYLTKGVDYEGATLEYKPVLSLGDNFEIPFSIRTEKEAHLFLCDGKYPPTSNCYWFMLQAWKGTGSAIRKCPKNQIPNVDRKYPHKPCKTTYSKINHTTGYPTIFSESNWSHFKISKTGNNLSFSHMDKNGTENRILNHQDVEDPINVTHMIIHSKVVNGLWKIHNIDFIYTRQESDNVHLGPLIYSQRNNYLCISMFVSMCSSCKIKLTVARAKSNDTVGEKTFYSQNSEWSEVKFIVENVENYNGFKLLVSTIGSDPDKFWAIDSVRLCQKTEFRLISLSERADCQLVSYEDNKISLPLPLSESESTCPENTIGDLCVPCDWIFPDCSRITVCDKSKCVCSAGYEGKNCYYECPENSYGHGCRKQCGNCYYTCNNVNGICPRSYCKDNYYTGPRCDIRPAIIFTKPPEITAGYSSATITVLNFETENGLDNEKPESYVVQFKKADSTSVWNSASQPLPFGRSTPSTISNLEADTEYFVRAVIISDKGKTYDSDSYTIYTKFKTKCYDVSAENIEIILTNTSVVIRQKSQEICKMGRYYVYIIPKITSESEIKPRVILPTFGNDRSLSFNSLLAFTYYVVTFQNIFNVTVRTTEGVPAHIIDFRTTGTSSSRIEIQWSNETVLWGDLRHYVVEYKFLSYIACRGQSSATVEKKRIETTNSFAVLENLTPYSNYMVSVFAVNTKFEGPPTTKQTSTLASPNVEADEIPTTEISTASSSINIKLNTICEKIRGPIMVKSSAMCTNDWCTKSRKAKEIDLVSSSSFYLDNLTPFSNYTVEVKFCRNESNCNSVPQKHTFQTEPAVPNSVRDLLIYSKDEHSISLRWKPPYPPNGILEDYQINYFYTGRRNNKYGVHTVTVNTQPCSLWPDFHCSKLSELEEEKTYTINIQARNKQPTGLGALETIRTETKKEPPEQPYDLVTKWTSQNDLELEWKHPNKSNGDIVYFEIILTSSDEEIKDKLPIINKTYQLIYQSKIDSAKIAPAKSYHVKITANNGEQGKAAFKTVISPPDVPKLDKNLHIYGSNNVTASVAISPKKIKGQSDNYRVILLISDENSNLETHPDIDQYGLKNFRIVFNCSLNTTLEFFDLTVGDNKQPTDCERTKNPPLKPATDYNITIVLVNTYGDKTRSSAYSKGYKTSGKPIILRDSSLLGLLALLLLIPIAAVIYLKRDEIMSFKNSLVSPNNPSTEFLEIQEDQIPLSNVAQNIAIQKKIGSDSNKTQKIHSKSIKITDFEEYVKEAIVNGELERQHALFPRGQTRPWKCASLKENKSKNRYNNLLAYDHTRVILEKIDDDPCSDYINANYIDGHKVPRAYIATQGPKASTLNDFWRMIWQENVRHIVNLANIYEGGKKKVEKYWPDINETVTFGKIAVQHVSTKVYADYEYRVFTVTNGEDTRKIDQLHFSSWPDHGVPLYSQSLVPFLQKMLQLPLSPKSPIVVHCSAGVGRTGTILLCDVCLRMAAREGCIDVLRNLQNLREQRANMVDNIEQYKLAHLVVLECLVGLHTSVPCNEIDKAVERLLENDSLTLQMRYLKDTQWQDQAMKTVGQTVGEVPIVKEKNRFANIIPEIQGRVFLSRFPLDDDTSTYINAVKVDGFRSPGRFIVTQQPLPNTLGDFWRLIEEENVTVIISLNTVNPQDKTYCHFWPTTKQPQMEAVPHITLKHINTQSLDYYNVVTVHLVANSRKEHVPVRIIQMKKWPAKTNCPKSVEHFLAFWEEADSLSRQSQPVVVTCYDGVKASGLYVALSFIIEKMKLEQVCDVCQAVRTVRHNREQFVQDIEQFEFLYRAAVLFINGFEPYANFN